MRPDWKPLQPDDPLYDAAVPKWAAEAYGIDAAGVPEVGPDDHTVSNGHWTIERIPPENVIGSRFIASKPLAPPGAPIELPPPEPGQQHAGKLGLHGRK